MSVATQISRIESNRNIIRAKLVELGMANNTDKLDRLAAAIEGLVNRGAVSVEIKEGTSYTIPAGYHNGSGVVKAVSDVTGDAETYKTQAKSVTPTKNQQSIVPDEGYYALESVTVHSIPDAYQDVTSVTADSSDVLTGKVIVLSDGTVAVGTMPNNGAVNQVLDATTISYTIPKGYHSGSGVVNISLETKSVTPSKSTQTITPSTGKVLSKVTVEKIPDEYQDVTGVTAEAQQVLAGYDIVTSSGEIVSGSMPNNGPINATIDGLTITAYSIPEGYTRGGSVSLTNDIEMQLEGI